jgi:hypothetical protein
MDMNHTNVEVTDQLTEILYSLETMKELAQMATGSGDHLKSANLTVALTDMAELNAKRVAAVMKQMGTRL